MPWVKLDTGFARHPKVIRLSDREFRAHVMAMCWVGEARTNGHIPPEALPVIMATRRTASSLVAAGLWELNRNGWEIHGWLDFNPSKEQDDHRREEARKRQAKARASRRDTKRE